MIHRILNCLLIFCFLLSGVKGIAQQNQNTGLNAVKAEVDTLNSKGFKMFRHDASKALLLFVRAEQLAEDNKYREGLAAAYVNQAEVFSQRGYSKRALLLYYQALAISQQDGDEYHAAQCEQHISTVKRKLKEFTEAARLLNHALVVFTRLHKPVDISNVQLRLGLLSQSLKHYDKALNLYDQAYQTSLQARYTYGEKKSYYSKGLLYEDLKNYPVALKWFNHALKIDTLTHDNYGKALSYLEIARIYNLQQQHIEAEKYAVLSYTNANSVGGIDITRQAAIILLHINRYLHNTDGVIKWQDKLLTISAQVTEQEKKEAITFMDVFKQQQENQSRYLAQIDRIKKVSQEKTIYLKVFLIIVCIGFALGIPLHFSYRRARAYALALTDKNEQIEEKSAAVQHLNSQIVQQNKELAQDNNLKNKLLSVISHDLRHPLVNTRSLLDIYNQQMLSQEEAKTLFGQLEAQYVRTITLLDNLLFWIKRQVQHAEAKKNDNAITGMVNELIEEQKLALHNKKLTVTNYIDCTVNWYADREALRIVFRNLLNNALKFTPDKGSIQFTSVQTDGFTAIVIKDSGIGMGPSKLKKVIEGSYMTTNGTAGEMGTGFGLLLVRDLISKNGGTLEIESSPGVGSSFVIRFPQYTSAAPLHLSQANQEIS